MLQIVLINVFVSFCIVYYMVRKTSLRRQAQYDRMRARREHMKELLKDVRKK